MRYFGRGAIGSINPDDLSGVTGGRKFVREAGIVVQNFRSLMSRKALSS